MKKVFAIVEDSEYVGYETWYNEVIDIFHTDDIHKAAKFATKEEAERAFKRVCYPRRMNDSTTVKEVLI